MYFGGGLLVGEGVWYFLNCCVWFCDVVFGLFRLEVFGYYGVCYVLFYVLYLWY